MVMMLDNAKTLSFWTEFAGRAMDYSS